MVFLGLGSNIGDRRQTIASAVSLLEQQPGITICLVSSLYETIPVGYADQPDFLNAVIGIDTSYSPEELLDICMDVERSLGRIREKKWGPRTIDIDILLYDELQLESAKLILPHPFFHERLFVLVPLAEIAPHLPVYKGRTAQELLAGFKDAGVRLFLKAPWGG